jgi:hypothetical protein
MAGYVGKGNWNEWETARAISNWLTDKADKTQLIRSVQSGGNIKLRDAALYQVGDLAPNGPKGEVFRRHFGVECKNYQKDPEWWHAFTCAPGKWIVAQWWNKIVNECVPHRLSPLLIMKRNRCPTVVMMNLFPCQLVTTPDLTVPVLGVGVITLNRFFTYPPETWYKAVQPIGERV